MGNSSMNHMLLLGVRGILTRHLPIVLYRRMPTLCWAITGLAVLTRATGAVFRRTTLSDELRSFTGLWDRIITAHSPIMIMFIRFLPPLNQHPVPVLSSLHHIAKLGSHHLELAVCMLLHFLSCSCPASSLVSVAANAAHVPLMVPLMAIASCNEWH